jgi:2-polyprenyl-3-methyl-5-hydroxy-6-metoxy-1,4-benzoquinol methylase
MIKETFSEELVLHEGIYFAKFNEHISYPEIGNVKCFALEDNSFWFRHRNNCIIALFKQFSAGKTFLDVGGGNGFVSKGLQVEGQTAILLEPGKSGCMNARQRGVKHIVCSTLKNARINPDSIDSIGSFDVVEHIKNEQEFLETIYQSLKPGGYFYCTVPAYKWLWSHEDVKAGHYRRYSLKEVKAKMIQAGFEITYASYFFSFLVLPIFIFRSLPSKIRFSKRVSEESPSKDHNQVGLFSKLIQGYWNWEFKRIRRLGRIPFGSSCIIVAKKKGIFVQP